MSTFYLAWCEYDETTFGSQHMREDELIFSFELKHEEGQFAELVLEIINPRMGLLEPPLWAWFSWDDGTTVHPLFFGRLLGLPDDLFAEIIKIKLVARSSDYTAQLKALSDSMRVLPYYDPIFLSDKKLDDPNVVLEGYSKLWHVDRLTHVVTASDITTGEDGTVTFTEDDVLYDGVSVRVSGLPLVSCQIIGEVGWTQCDHTGAFEFKTVTNVDGDPNVSNGIKIKSGLQSSTASSGGGGGGGGGKKQDEFWTSAVAETQCTYSWEYKNPSPGPHGDGDLMEEKGSITIPFYGGEQTKSDEKTTYPDPDSGTGEEYSISETYKYQEPVGDNTKVTISPGTSPDPKPVDNTNNNDKSASVPTPTQVQVAVEVEQARKEMIEVLITADVQPVLIDETDDNKLMKSLTMNARDLVEAGVLTSHDPVYFSTARGLQSIEFLTMVARANLLAGARILEISWESPLINVVNLSCRMNAVIQDPRLPGGSAIGKIVSYEMNGDGDKGQIIGKVTINSSVGN